MAGYDSDDWRKQRDEILLGWLDGDRSALDFILVLSNFVEFIDDVVDQDKELGIGRATVVMADVLCHLPFNSFFQAHNREFRGMIMSAIVAWTASEELKRSTDETNQALAFALRDQIISITHTAVAIKRGFDFAQSISKHIYALTRNDTFSEYKKECQLADQNQ